MNRYEEVLRVLEKVGCTDTDLVRRIQEEAEKEEAYVSEARRIGYRASLYRSLSQETAGASLMSDLIGFGWTPPEGVR